MYVNIIHRTCIYLKLYVLHSRAINMSAAQYEMRTETVMF